MELRTGSATPAKADVFTQVTTPIPTSIQEIDSTYPKVNDGDSDNTGSGTDIVTFTTFDGGTKFYGFVAGKGMTNS